MMAWRTQFVDRFPRWKAHWPDGHLEPRNDTERDLARDPKIRLRLIGVGSGHRTSRPLVLLGRSLGVGPGPMVVFAP